MIDARTKWIEVLSVTGTAAHYTISKLQEVFARRGLPKQLVTDDGPPFTSADFANFINNYDIEHLFSAPYHPASNGAAVNAVRTIKKAIGKQFANKKTYNCF